jgi:hypothetical protein
MIVRHCWGTKCPTRPTSLLSVDNSRATQAWSDISPVLSDGISGCGPGKFKTAVMNIVGYIARFNQRSGRDVRHDDGLHRGVTIRTLGSGDAVHEVYSGQDGNFHVFITLTNEPGALHCVYHVSEQKLLSPIGRRLLN